MRTIDEQIEFETCCILLLFTAVAFALLFSFMAYWKACETDRHVRETGMIWAQFLETEKRKGEGENND